MTLPAVAASITVAVMLALGAMLLVTKAVNSWRGRFEAIRRAAYIAVFGELTARGSYPLEILSSWSDDRVFRTALVDFIRLLDGIERDRLVRVARDLGIVDSAIIALRKSRRAKARVRAATLLSELADPKTVRPLMAALGDSEAGVRINAAAALAKIGEPAAVDAVLRVIDRETEWDAARAMDHLAALGAAAVDGLLSYVGDLSERVPRYAHLAIQTLGEIGDLRAEPALLAALRSPVADLRLVAAAALQTGGSFGSVGPLIAAMADEDGRVRARAAKSLGAHFDTRAIEPLYAGLSDPEWWVRKNSAAALAQLPEGVPALQRALRDDDPFARDAAREQLMILGVPAGNTDTVEPDEVGHAHDWIDDQLRELERSAAASRRAEPVTPLAVAPAGDDEVPPGDERSPSTGRADAGLSVTGEPTPASSPAAGDQDLGPAATGSWPVEPGRGSARMGGVPRHRDEAAGQLDRPAPAPSDQAVMRTDGATRPSSPSLPALGSSPTGPAAPSEPGAVPSPDAAAPEPEDISRDGRQASGDRLSHVVRADSLAVLDLTLESHGLGAGSRPDPAASSTRRAS